MSLPKAKIVAIHPHEAGYHFLLNQIPDPPKVLHCLGRLPDPNEKCIAVVGTRQITPYGIEATQKITKELVEAGYTIVSGFMYGVDAWAHKVALDCHGKTIGVLGFGFDHMYPQSHAALARQMLASGNTLLTEYPLTQGPTRYTFPRRNRIVAGMCWGTVVIEAGVASGSKITARLASEYGRSVFAVPGPIDSPFSEGTKELVNLGAKLVTSAADIIEDMPNF